MPGNTVSLVELNERILQANQAFAVLAPVPPIANNWQPRVGFNWNPKTSRDGIIGLLTGGDKMVLRGGYAMTHDYAFLNIALNIASSFPFVAAIAGNNLPNAFTVLQNTPAGVPAGSRPEHVEPHCRGG